MLEFEWDPEKAESNVRRHGVSFEEASTAFNDDLLLTFNDPDHSEGEMRLLAFGTSAFGKPVAVSFTERGDRIRLISARRMTSRERIIYEQ